ncbi:MAG: hypothetical protein L3J79_07575 [Candidatus Marinimicrobia bacterium]|nr:hypothetical protein [Candidatus Neomarinimicrobiota bacterium]
MALYHFGYSIGHQSIMKHFSPPSNLNAYQLYQQVNRIAKRTSRAKNPDWYAEPLDVPRQWHLWMDGEEVVSVLFDRVAKRWAEGPDMSCLVGGMDAELSNEDTEELHAGLAEALRSRELGGRVKSLGVILHLADEFAVMDPARDYSARGDFDKLQALLQGGAEEVLGDSTVEPLVNTWRLLPCWGVKEGKRNMVLQMSRCRENFLSIIREYGVENNVAIRAAGMAAPLQVLRLAPFYLEWKAGRGDIIVMVYRSFSALAVLNEEGELVLLRSLAHRPGMECPSGLGDVLVNTRASTGLSNPVVTILPMGSKAGQDGVTGDLTSFFSQREPMDIGFNELDQLDFLQEVPGHRLEMFIGDEEALAATIKDKDLQDNTTFTGLSSGWASQDFFPVSVEEEERYPTWQDLQLRKWFGVVKMSLLVAVVGLAIWGGLKVMKITATEAWQAGDQGVTISQGRALLVKEQQQLDYWQPVMQKRSQGWLVMEVLLDLFPEGSGVVMDRCDYTISIVVPARRGGKNAAKAGFVRQWDIKGFAKSKASKHLNNLSGNAFVKGVFQEIAEKHGAGEFDMRVEGRNLNVTLQREQKKYPKAGVLGKDDADYNTGFTLVIRQRFSVEDPLALPSKMAGVVAEKK